MPEQSRQHAYRQEEAGTAGDPTLAVRGDATAGHDTMQMGVMKQILPPGVKHGEEADFRAEVLGVGGDSAQGLRRGAEENAVNHLFVLIGDGGNLFRYGEDDVEIRSG